MTGGDQARAEGASSEAGYTIEVDAAGNVSTRATDLIRCPCGRGWIKAPSPSPQQPDGHDHTRESEDQG